MPVLKAINSRASLTTAVNYVLRKAEDAKGINCRSETAVEEMLITKSYYGQEGGRQYLHLALSFPPGEGTPADVMKAALQFVKREPKLQGHETVIGVHVDRDHLHAHILANSVSIATGKKLHTSKKDLDAMKLLQNEICAEMGYDAPEKKRDALEVGQVQDPWLFKLLLARQNDKPVNSWIYDLAEKIVLAKSKAKSREDYEHILAHEGVTLSAGKQRKHFCYIIIDEEGEHKIRDSRLSRILGLECGKEYLDELERCEISGRNEGQTGRGEGGRRETVCHDLGSGIDDYVYEVRPSEIERRKRNAGLREREARCRERNSCEIVRNEMFGAPQIKKRSKGGRFRTIDD